MGRKRTYQHARYDEEIRTSHSRFDYTPASLASAITTPPFPAEMTERWRRQAGRFPNQPRTRFYEPTKNGHYHPPTVAMVVDALLRVEADAYLFAGGLVEKVLKQEYRHIIWDPYTVGRILAELQAVAGDKHPPNGGNSPLNRLQWGGATVYVLDPSLASWHWLGAVREQLFHAANDYLEAVWNGEIPTKSETMWVDLLDIPWGIRPEAYGKAAKAA